MKLLLRYIFLLLTVPVFIPISCVKVEGEPAVPDTGDSDGYLSVNVSFLPAVRTRNFDDVMEGMSHEVMVNSARLVIYSSGVATLVEDFDDITNVAADGISLADRFTGSDVLRSDNPYAFSSRVINIADKGVRLGRDCYAFMALNPGPELKAVTELGKTISDLETATEYSAAEFMGGDATNRFLMTNAEGLVAVRNLVHLHSTEQKAKDNPLIIPLMRGVSMVCISIREPMPAAGDQNLDQVPEYLYLNSSPPVGYDGTDRNVVFLAETATLRWGVNVVNKKSYWLRKLTYDKYGDMEIPGFFRYNPYECYAEDPNFQGLSIFSGGSVPERERNFTYITDASLLTMELTPTWQSRPVLSYGTRNKHYVYIPENTMASSDQQQEVATSVAVKVNLRPYADLWPSETDMPPIGKHFFECGFMFEDGYMSKVTFLEDDINEFLKDVCKIILDGGTLSNTIDSQQNPIYEEIARSVWLQDAVEYLRQHGWDGNSAPDWDNIESFKAGEFSFYHNGEMYFNTPIQHFDSGQYYGLGFGVVRSGIYHLLFRPYLSNVGTIKPEVPGQEWDVLKIYNSSWEIVDTDFEVSKPIS